MPGISDIISFFLHLDRHLAELIRNCGSWSYLILFLTVFAETGLVVTPFLPGDSLLFVAGTFAAAGSFNVVALYAMFLIAAVLGDGVNYAIGKRIGEKVFREDAKILKKEYLNRTHMFFEKHGGKAVVFARFVPLMRTFVPFVAGAGSMTYPKFLFYNVSGGLIWVTLFVLGGYFFGNMPFVKNNFSAVILAIIAVSLIPAVVEFVRHARRGK
jgi:membrane-associated protein